MNEMITYNAKRQERTENRVRELIDEIRENPTASQTQIVKTLAKRWDKSEDTVIKVVQFAKRKKLIKKVMTWSIR